MVSLSFSAAAVHIHPWILCSNCLYTVIGRQTNSVYWESEVIPTASAAAIASSRRIIAARSTSSIAASRLCLPPGWSAPASLTFEIAQKLYRFTIVVLPALGVNQSADIIQSDGTVTKPPLNSATLSPTNTIRLAENRAAAHHHYRPSSSGFFYISRSFVIALDSYLDIAIDCRASKLPYFIGSRS